MTKTYCDRCREEISNREETTWYMSLFNGGCGGGVVRDPKQLCRDCVGLLTQWLKLKI